MNKGINVGRCPSCDSEDVYLQVMNTKVTDCLTEINLPSHCANCGYTYRIVYQPDRFEER